MKRLVVLIFLQFCVIVSLGEVEQAQRFRYNSLRLAYYRFGEELAAGHADGYLRRAAACRYNYVVAEFDLNTAKDVHGIGGKKEDFRRAFKRVHEYGMRMIPKLQLGSKWSLHWTAVGNDNIQMNVYHDGVRSWGCPSFAHDADGIDASFEELLLVLKKAFEEAELPYGLDFIDLGHDEPVDDGYLLIGGIPDDLAGPEDRFAQADREFILNRIEDHGEDVSTAFQTLIVDELFRRVNQVQRILGEDTRILVYGDLWDPEANGGIEKRTFLSEEEEVCYDKGGRAVSCRSPEAFRSSSRSLHVFSRMTPGIGTLPGLTEEQRQIFRKSVILRPWCYYDAWPFGAVPGKDGYYDAEKTFGYFSDHGLKFVYTSVHYEKPSDSEYTEAELRAMKKYVRVSRHFTDHCYGYAAAPWETRWQDPPGTPAIFNTLEELYELNKDYIP